MARPFDPETLRKLDVEGGAIESSLNYDLRRKDAIGTIEPRFTMRGMYSYMADAALFEECISGRRFQVAQEADNLALERAYLEAQRQPGEALLVSLGFDGRPSSDDLCVSGAASWAEGLDRLQAVVRSLTREDGRFRERLGGIEALRCDGGP